MIKVANAVYTGGGIWLFYGELKNRKYFLTDDNGYTYLLDEDPSNLDESSTYEWQEEHIIKEVTNKEDQKYFCGKLLDWLYAHPENRGGMTETEMEIYRTWFSA